MFIALAHLGIVPSFLFLPFSFYRIDKLRCQIKFRREYKLITQKTDILWYGNNFCDLKQNLCLLPQIIWFRASNQDSMPTSTAFGFWNFSFHFRYQLRHPLEYFGWHRESALGFVKGGSTD